VAIAEPPHRPQIARRVRDHARRPLDEGLHHHRGDLLLAHRELPGDVVGVPRLDPVRFEEQRLEGGVEERHAADRDRADRVAVVGALEADERGLPDVLSAAVPPVLERHLQRDLHRGRARVRVEDPVQPRRGDPDKPPRELGGAAVGEPQHRRVRDVVELLADRLVDRGVAMAVDVAPQR
jgi:hypothetical protein